MENLWVPNRGGGAQRSPDPLAGGRGLLPLPKNPTPAPGPNENPGLASRALVLGAVQTGTTMAA